MHWHTYAGFTNLILSICHCVSNVPPQSPTSLSCSTIVGTFGEILFSKDKILLISPSLECKAGGSEHESTMKVFDLLKISRLQGHYLSVSDLPFLPWADHQYHPKEKSDSVLTWYVTIEGCLEQRTPNINSYSPRILGKPKGYDGAVVPIMLCALSCCAKN